MDHTLITRPFGGQDTEFSLHGVHLRAAEAEARVSIVEMVSALKAAVLALASAGQDGDGAPAFRTAYARSVIKHGMAGGISRVSDDRLSRLMPQLEGGRYEAEVEEAMVRHFDGDIASRHILLAAEIAAAAFYGRESLEQTV